MTGIKRAREEICNLCNGQIKLFDINVNTSLAMCENEECVYPFDQPDVEGLIIETPHNETRYSKKLKTHSSSVANIQPLKASDDDNISVKSVEESSFDHFDTSSLPTQTNELTSLAEKELLLDDLNNITQAPPAAAMNVCLPASSGANNYSIQDIELLLTDNLPPQPTAECSPASTVSNTPKQSTLSIDCSSPTSPNVNTPKDDTNLNWIEDIDVLFGEDMAQSKFNPLDGDTEFDTVLGI